jgi:hypothetical protein
MITAGGGVADITRIGSLPPNSSDRRAMLNESIEGDEWDTSTTLGRLLAQELRIA